MSENIDLHVAAWFFFPCVLFYFNLLIPAILLQFRKPQYFSVAKRAGGERVGVATLDLFFIMEKPII